MRVINVKTGESFSAALHTKEPSYFATSDKRRKVTIDGEAAEMVMHPKKPDGPRVSFKVAGVDYFVDNPKLHAAVTEGKSVMAFTTAVGRAKKADAEATSEAPEKGAQTAAAA